MTPVRFALAVGLFNLAALAVVAFAVRQWRNSAPIWLTHRGWCRFSGTPLHVSRGVGMERVFEIPVRFLCRPEICLINVSIE